MRPEEIDENIPEEDIKEDAPEEDVQEDDPEETSDPDPEEAPEPFWKREDLKEVVVKKDTIQKRGEASTEDDASSADLTEYYSPASDLVYSDDVFEQLIAEQQTTNALLVRITNQNDLFLGIGVALIICCICYSVLERFTRF